jgi:hypothetical protein
VGVSATEQAADAPVPLSVQLPPPAKGPTPVSVTVPVGTAVAPAGVVTVAVHVELCCAITVAGKQATATEGSWNSKAPISHADSPGSGRCSPRWSVLVQLADGIWSIAGLPFSSENV